MNYSFTTTILIASVCFSMYEAESTPCETNGMAGCEGAYVTKCTDTKEAREIEKAIAKVPEMMFSQTNQRKKSYVASVCEKISKFPRVQMRNRYYLLLMESACKVNLAKIGELVPPEKKEGPKSRLGLQIVGLSRREEKIVFLLDDAYRSLDWLASEIWEKLSFARIPASGLEQFEPFFKLIEKLKAEGERLRDSPLSSDLIRNHVEEISERVERLYFSVYLRYSRNSPDPQDRALVEARFEQVVGRPMCSSEKYEAELRERMENDEKKQREKTMRRKKQGEQP